MSVFAVAYFPIFGLNMDRYSVSLRINTDTFYAVNTKNIFLAKSYTKCGGETSPRPFSEKLKFSISLDH